MAEPEIHLARYAAEDRPAVETLLLRIYGGDERSRTYPEFAATGAVVAREGANVVGVAGAWAVDMHPLRRRCTVAVAPTHRRRGLGGKLWHALADAAGLAEAGVVTSCWETQHQGLSFARAHGFVEVRRTYTALLAPAGGPAPDDWPGYPAPPEYSRSSVSALQTDGERRTVALVSREIYTRTHAGNPPAHLSESQWMAHTFPEDLIAPASFAIRFGDRIVGVACLHRGTGGSVELGWHGVAADHLNMEPALVRWAVEAQLLWARQKGVRTVMLECDTTDPAALAVLDGFWFNPAAAWVTLMRDPALPPGPAGGRTA